MPLSRVIISWAGHVYPCIFLIGGHISLGCNNDKQRGVRCVEISGALNCARCPAAEGQHDGECRSELMQGLFALCGNENPAFHSFGGCIFCPERLTYHNSPTNSFKCFSSTFYCPRFFIPCFMCIYVQCNFKIHF